MITMHVHGYDLLHSAVVRLLKRPVKPVCSSQLTTELSAVLSPPNDLPPELWPFFLSPPSPLPITRDHLPSSDASIHHPRNFHSKLKCHLFENSYPHVIIHPPNLNDIHLNSYSVFSDFLEIGPVLTMDYPLNNPLHSLQRSWICWCPYEFDFWVAL